MASRQREHQIKRRAEGRCGREGCKEITGKRFYCAVHRAEHRQRTRAAKLAKRNDARRSAGENLG